MQKLVVILGTNASGKSDLGIRLANHFGGEVVSADSRQVYRGLDLGSGKITPAQAGTVKHHLIDVADVSEYYSLAQYQRAAYSAIDSISGAGKLPFLVGGTGLYISAIVEGYQLVDVPPNDPLRAELESLPLPQLVERLEKSDPDAASRIDKSNRRRLIRAIEIASAGHANSAAHKSSPRYNCLQLGLTWPREILEERIEKRLRERLANGMIDEVAGLRSRGVSDIRLDKLGLEYRYITRYLRGELRTLDDLRPQLGIAIRQFAQRATHLVQARQQNYLAGPLRRLFSRSLRPHPGMGGKTSLGTVTEAHSKERHRGQPFESPTMLLRHGARMTLSIEPTADIAPLPEAAGVVWIIAWASVRSGRSVIRGTCLLYRPGLGGDSFLSNWTKICP